MANKRSFIAAVGKIARAEYLSRDKWVLPSVCIAQAALESGWNLNAKTLFGIKSSHGISLATQEYIDGKMQSVRATFKSYPNISAAVDGYYDLITTNRRYAAAVNNPQYVGAITAIKAGGYATDPDYVSKIITIIEHNNLTAYDSRAATNTNLDAVAKDVIAGKYGNGAARRSALERAGYNYAEVQARVNKILRG